MAALGWQARLAKLCLCLAEEVLDQMCAETDGDRQMDDFSALDSLASLSLEQSPLSSVTQGMPFDARPDCRADTAGTVTGRTAVSQRPIEQAEEDGWPPACPASAPEPATRTGAHTTGFSVVDHAAAELARAATDPWEAKFRAQVLPSM